MKVHALDDNHDWTFGSSQSNLISDSYAVKQCVKTRCLSFFRNWSLSLDHGIDWFRHFEKNANYAETESDIRSNVESVWGVASVVSVGLWLDTVTRKLTVDVSYIDIFGKSQKVLTDVRD